MICSIIVEVRPYLQVCNVFLMTEESLGTHESVKINLLKPSSIDLQWSYGANSVIFQHINLDIVGYKLLPHSLSALHIEKNSITFRLQTEPLNNFAGSFTSEVLAYKHRAPTHSSEKFVPCVDIGKQCNFTCRCCGNIITQDKTIFERLLPLPSASWETGDWFCHRHSTSPEPEEGLIHRPKKTDCLYGSCFICIPICSLNVCTSSDIVLRCNRCLSWLGTRHDRSAKLWNCSVEYGKCKGSSAPLDDFHYIVKEAIQDSVGMLCRLILECYLSEKETHYILLWVMDKDLQLLVDFASSTSNNEKDAKGEYKCKLKSKQSIKLLYLYVKACTPMVKSWQDDVNVQTIDVAKQMFTEGLQHLVEVTELIPAPNRIANGFFVSYLGLC